VDRRGRGQRAEVRPRPEGAADRRGIEQRSGLEREPRGAAAQLRLQPAGARALALGKDADEVAGLHVLLRPRVGVEPAPRPHVHRERSEQADQRAEQRHAEEPVPGHEQDRPLHLQREQDRVEVRGVVGGDDRTAPRRQLLFAGAVVGEEDAEQGLEDGQQPAADHGAEAAEARFGWRPGSASSSGRTAASSSSSARAISGAPSVEPAAAQHLEPRAQLGHAPRADVAAAAEEAVGLALEHGGVALRRLADGREPRGGDAQEGRHDLVQQRAVVVDRHQVLHDALVELLALRGLLGRRALGARDRRAHPLAQHRLELVGRHRLGDVVVHAGLEALLAVALHGARGHRDDRDAAGAARLALADLARRLVAVHPRHLAVHQHGVVAAARAGRERLLAVLGELDAEAQLLEDLGRDLLVDLVVLGHQHVRGDGPAAARAGCGA
jgi:hypothetical protein